MIDVHAGQPSLEIFDQMRVRRVHALPGVVVLLLAGLVALQLWARSTDYGLRVTSDTPTFLALIPEMADRPFERQSPFFGIAPSPRHTLSPTHRRSRSFGRAPGCRRRSRSGGARASAVPGGDRRDVLRPVRRLRLYAQRRGQMGGVDCRAALLALFGPTNVIWASDLSLHGFLYASWYPQNVAIGFLLFTLLALDWRRRASLPLTIVLTALTMTIHPFTGVLLTLLVAARGCQLAVQRDERWRHASYALVGGFALGSLWPAYSLSHAMSETRMPGGLFVAVAASAPLLISSFAGSRPVGRTVAFGEAVVRHLASRSKAHWLAFGGFVTVLGLGFWAAALARRPSSDPLITTNRLSTYWVEDRWRWPLMLAVGAIGIYGLLGWPGEGTSSRPCGSRLLHRGDDRRPRQPRRCPDPDLVSLPARHTDPARCGRRRCDPGPSPAHDPLRGCRRRLCARLQGADARRLPPTHTYFGTDIQDAYSLGKVIANRSGVVATDPRTAYYIPGATGNRVLTVTKAHVGSPRELQAAEQGYAALHEFWSGRQSWWHAAQRMWLQGCAGS